MWDTNWERERWRDRKRERERERERERVGDHAVPVTVVVELIVGCHCDKSSPSTAQGVKDLRGSVSPHLIENTSAMAVFSFTSFYGHTILIVNKVLKVLYRTKGFISPINGQ